MITEYRNPSPYGAYLLTPAADGNIWFSGPSAARVTRITPTGTVTVFERQLGGLPSEPGGIAGGPDGNVWLTGYGALRRVTPDGTFSDVSDGLGQPASLFGIAPGPDGALWFTDFGFRSKAIGRVAADGTITQFPLSDDAFPQEIAAGPDGNVWFTNSASAIDRISPTGTPLPGYTVEGVVGLLAPGPDGALWFTRTGNVKAVGRIVPGGGEPTSFTAGIDQLAGFGGLATGPDGNLWFTQSGTISYGGTTFAGTVNRITPDGVVTTYATGLSPGARPGDIAAGSDGRMWFTDGLGSVAAIGTGAPDASVSRPAVTGSATVGSTLTCGGDSWSTWAGQQPSRTVFGFDGYRWLRDGAALPDPPSATHVVSVQDLSHALTCSATVTYPLLNVTTSATSAPVTVPAPLPVRLGGAATVRRGRRAKLVFTVRNATRARVRGVVVTAVLPQGLSVDAASRAANLRLPARLRFRGAGRTLTFLPGPLAARASVTLRVDARVSPRATPGPRAVTVTVRAPGVPAVTFSRNVTVRR
ncbi:MAG: hypothetical protein U0237_13845 [Thermoleophilia bacterium]